MAAELDRTSTGQAAFFGVKQSAWHGSGVVLNEAPTLEEAIRLAGHDYEVATEPVYRRRSDGAFEPVPGAQVTVRGDRDVVLGVVGKDYHPLQNRDAFRVLEPLLDAGVAELETGGTLREGRDVWMLVKYNIDDPVVREVYANEVVPYGVVLNNHAGERQVTVMETPIRIVCMNTYRAALVRAKSGEDRAIKLRHTANVGSNLVAAAEEMFSGIVERHRRIAEQYQLLKSTVLEEESFRRMILDVIAPLPTEPPANAWAERALDKTLDRRSRVRTLWEKGVGHTGDHSAWEAWGAITQSIDHDRDLWPVRASTSRAQSELDGRLGNLKQKVLDRLVIYSSGVSLDDAFALEA